MKLTVLVDNTVLPEGYAQARAGRALSSEHGSSFCIEADGQKFLFDLGFTDLFIRNAKKISLSLANVDKVIFSHNHYDHTGGIRYLRDVSSCRQIVAHKYAALPRNDGEGFLTKAVSSFELIGTVTEPLRLTDNLVFLGQIPQFYPFEVRQKWEQVFVDGQAIDDYCLDDSALIYRSPEGIVVITGCSHSGICNIVHQARTVAQKLWGLSRIQAVLGGMHLIHRPPEFLAQVMEALEQEGVVDVYPSHCTDLSARMAFACASFNVYEMGVGTQVEF